MKRVPALTVAALIVAALIVATAMATDARAQPAPTAPPPPPTSPVNPYGLPPTPRQPIDFPEVLTTPTGWLLPAAVLYSKNAVDTGGGVTSDTRVGLGDVAEFGVATTDQVREHNTLEDKPERIQPYITASFRLGVSENRLFEHQPGVTLGFRKSFERKHSGFKSRIAELTLVASKHLGPRAAMHVGGSLWDASLQSTAEVGPDEEPPPEVTLHGHGRARQLRAFGGLEARPLPRSSILIDLGWGPEFCYACADEDKIRLRPELSWGVRYEVAYFMHLESGVRVPDIGNFNLLDAQIFGQVTFTSYALRTAVDSLK
ncbi:MAG TPA: hypothetical protein VLM79_09820 [Kofleriaceae bacterium]|nr:hypothetical protein [Kofleriaceae bacterium]